MNNENELIAALATIEKLRSERDQLAAENVALKAFGVKLSEMHNALNGEGTGIQGRAEVACQQVALEAAMEEFDDIKTPATDGIVAGIKADGVESGIKTIMVMLNHQAQGVSDTINVLRIYCSKLHDGDDK